MPRRKSSGKKGRSSSSKSSRKKGGSKGAGTKRKMKRATPRVGKDEPRHVTVETSSTYEQPPQIESPAESTFSSSMTEMEGSEEA